MKVEDWRSPGKGVGVRVKKAKGPRSTDSPITLRGREVLRREYSQYCCNRHVWCQGALEIRGESLCEACDCLTSVLYA